MFAVRLPTGHVAQLGTGANNAVAPSAMFMLLSIAGHLIEDAFRWVMRLFGHE